MRLKRPTTNARGSLAYLLLILAAVISLLPSEACAQAAYTAARESCKITASGGTCQFDNHIGALNLTFELLINGSPSTSVVTTQGCGRGNQAAYGSSALGVNGLPTVTFTCDTLDVYDVVANSNRKVTGLYDAYVVIWTNTGGTTPTLQVNVLETSASSPSSQTDPRVFLNAAITSATTVKSNPGIVLGWMISNPNASACFLQIFDATSGNVTLGTTVPILSVPLGLSSVPNIVTPQINVVLKRTTTAISVAATTTATGGSTCATGVIVNLWFQ